MPVLYLLPCQNGHRVAKGSLDNPALLPSATLTLSCQPWLFAFQDPSQHYQHCPVVIPVALQCGVTTSLSWCFLSGGLSLCCP